MTIVFGFIKSMSIIWCMASISVSRNFFSRVLFLCDCYLPFMLFLLPFIVYFLDFLCLSFVIYSLSSILSFVLSYLFTSVLGHS